ncbi:MAG: hypothetical protein V2A66_02485 [Pseudomonadota bacterium]
MAPPKVGNPPGCSGIPQTGAVSDSAGSAVSQVPKKDLYVTSLAKRKTIPKFRPPVLFNGEAEKPAAEVNLGTTRDDRLQLAATSNDRRVFEKLKDDKDLEIRLALLDNKNFAGQPWLKKFKALYGSVRRARTIVKSSFKDEKLDSFDHTIDLNAICGKFGSLDEILALFAKYESDPRIRYAIALNDKLTEAQKKLFAEDAFIPIRRKINPPQRAIGLFDLIDGIDVNKLYLNVSEGENAFRKPLNAFRDKVGQEEFERLVLEISSKNYFESKKNPALHLIRTLQYASLSSGLVDRLLSLKNIDACRSILWNDNYEPSAPQIAGIYKDFPSALGMSLVKKRNAPQEVIADFAHRNASDPKRMRELIYSPQVSKYFDLVIAPVKEKKELRLLWDAAANNPNASPALLERLLSLPGADTELKALVFKVAARCHEWR